MNYTDATRYLYGLQKHGIKLGLDKVRTILSILGNPQDSFHAVHTAGTNGKGSVSAMVSSILTAHGHRTGLFTSPHLVSFTERIRVGSDQITEEEVVGLTGEIREAINRQNPELISTVTFFEFVMAMASVQFQRKETNWAVMEVGMGGRLDATNVIRPQVSVITRVGVDHREFLGDSLREIAGEKAGIIKAGIPVVSAAQEREVEEVIAARCREVSAPLFTFGREFTGSLVSSDLRGVTIHYRDDRLSLEDLFIPLAGEHQLINASVAIKTSLEALKDRADTALIREGLRNCRWPGRLDLVRRNPDIMIDGAHNPEAALALADFMQKNLGGRQVILVMGVMADKAVEEIITPLLPLASERIFTAPDYGRAASPEALAAIASKQGYLSETASSVKEAIERAIQKSRQSAAGGQESGKPAGEEPLILITGSFYTIGEAMEVLGEKAVLGTLREKL